MNGHETIPRTMGQTIRRLRMEQNLTQETLAELLGVTAQAVSNTILTPVTAIFCWHRRILPWRSGSVPWTVWRKP